MLNELMNINVKNYISLQAFLERYHFLNNRLKTLGIKYDDNVLRYILLKGIKSYNDS